MMYVVFIVAMLCALGQQVYAVDQSSKTEKMAEETTPKYLYKVLSIEDWKTSQSLSSVQLPPADNDFIHFSKEDQLDRIISKYWAGIPEYVILKIDTTKLPGKMVFEVNVGGITKYYHLYSGSIPLDAVVEAKVVTAPEKEAGH